MKITFLPAAEIPDDNQLDIASLTEELAIFRRAEVRGGDAECGKCHEPLVEAKNFGGVVTAQVIDRGTSVAICEKCARVVPGELDVAD
jgi:hypothetical protein